MVRNVDRYRVRLESGIFFRKPGRYRLTFHAVALETGKEFLWIGNLTKTEDLAWESDQTPTWIRTWKASGRANPKPPSPALHSHSSSWLHSCFLCIPHWG